MMLRTTDDARLKLEAEGLHVSCGNTPSLWIAATVRDVGAGIEVSQDACSLIWDSCRWVAVFPADGLLAYEVPGSLSELVPLVVAVYADYRRSGGRFTDAFRRVVPDAGQFLIGRSPAHA